MPRIVTLEGGPFSELLGAPVAVGQIASAVVGRVNGFSTETFDVIKDTAGKIRILSFAPSLATGICDAQTQHFNEALAERENVGVGHCTAYSPEIGQHPDYEAAPAVANSLL